MRTALISDIHGDLESLQIVLDDIASQNCDRILCLGDLVDGGRCNEEVVQLIRERNITTVQGNHDEHSSCDLSVESKQFLRTLPEEVIEDGVLYTHISPRLKKKKIHTAFEAWNVFDEFKYGLVFFGHVHRPMIWGEKCAEPVSATAHEIIFNQPFSFDSNDRYLICVGAVGQTRNWCPYRCYAIYDFAQYSVTFRALNTD